MPVITKKYLTESILALIEGGSPSSGKKFEPRMVEAHLQQVIDRRLKTEYLSVTLPTDETIPDGLVLATYNDIPVTQYKNVLSRALLPAIPVSLRRNMGVYFVGPATGDNVHVPPPVEPPIISSNELVLTIEAVVGGTIVITGTPFVVNGIIAGSSIVSCDAFANQYVNVIRGNIPLPGIDPGDGSNYFTKLLASTSLMFNNPLVAGEYVKIQTVQVLGLSSVSAGMTIENATTRASISDSVLTRLVYVESDETNNNDHSLYLYNGGLIFIKTLD